MNKLELACLLQKEGVNSSFYSLNGELVPDRMVLFQSYEKWYVFYYDERGNRRNESMFDSESDACKYLYEYFKKQYKIR